MFYVHLKICNFFLNIINHAIKINDDGARYMSYLLFNKKNEPKEAKEYVPLPLLSLNK